MSNKRFSYEEFSKIIIEILNENNGISTRTVNYYFSKKTGKQYWNSQIRLKLHKMRKDGLIKATYSIKEGYKWYISFEDVSFAQNENVVE